MLEAIALQDNVLKYEAFQAETDTTPAGVYKLKAYSKDGIYWILDYMFNGKVFMSFQSKTKADIWHDFELAKTKLL